MNEIVEKKTSKFVSSSEHEINENDPIPQKQIINVKIKSVDEETIRNENHEIKIISEETIIQEKVNNKKPIDENHQENHIEEVLCIQPITNKTQSLNTNFELINNDNEIQKQILNVKINQVNDNQLERINQPEIVTDFQDKDKSENLKSELTKLVNENIIKQEIQSVNNIKQVNSNQYHKTPNIVKKILKKEWDIQSIHSVESDNKISNDIVLDNRSVRSAENDNYWEIKSIQSITENVFNEQTNKFDLKSQNENFILVDQNKEQSINQQETDSIEENKDLIDNIGHVNLHFDFINSVDSDNKSINSNSIIMEEEWIEYRPQSVHSSSIEIQTRPNSMINLNLPINKNKEIKNSNLSTKFTSVSTKENKHDYDIQPIASSTIEIKTNSKYDPNFDFENKSIESDSVIMEDTWIEYYGLPTDAVNNQAKHKFDDYLPYPYDSVRSIQSNFINTKEEWKGLYRQPINLSTYEIENTYNPTIDVHDNYVPSMYNDRLSNKSNSVIMEDEWTEFHKVPLYSTSSKVSIQKDYPKNTKHSCIPKMVDHYSYRYENPTKTEKLRDLTNITNRDSSTMPYSPDNVLQSIYDSISRRHNPILPSTDCLKQTFHVDHEDEELLHTPVIYDADGEMIKNLSDTNNFKSVTEYVTLQISQSTALIKIEIAVEMFHNFQQVHETWKRKNVRLTRMIELDLSKVKDSKRLQEIIKRCNLDKPNLSWTDENGNVINQYNKENILTGKETFDIFSNLLAITHEEEAQYQPHASVKDEFYLTRGPSGQVTNVPYEPQYLLSGYSNKEKSYFYY